MGTTQGNCLGSYLYLKVLVLPFMLFSSTNQKAGDRNRFLPEGGCGGWLAPVGRGRWQGKG
jgi:hypothetical protein